MYGNKLSTEYGRTEGRHRDVVGELKTAPVGNLAVVVGRMNAPEGEAFPQGWHPTAYVVMRPFEAVRFAADVLEQLLDCPGSEAVAELAKARTGVTDARELLVEASEEMMVAAGEPVEGRCSLCGGKKCEATECRARVVVVESSLGDWEVVQPLVEQPVILTADHIELTIERLIEEAAKHNPDVVVVATADGWKRADLWLAEKEEAEES